MITLEEIRSQYPGANSLSDDELIGVVAERYGTTPDIFREAIGYKPAPVESPGIIGRAKDLGISALKGAIAVPEAAVGLADLVTGGYAGKAAEAVGFRPKEAKAILSEGYSDAQKRANEEVQKAEGVWDTVKAVASNPSVLAQTITESVPSMLGGGIIAGGLIKGTKLGATVGGRLAASGIGEGVVGAGSGAEQIRQQTDDGLLTGGQAAVAGLSGVATGALGVLGAKVAKSLGIADVDTMLAGAAKDTEMAKGITRRMLEGAVSEGLIEELPQSVQEQVAQNYALGRPLDEGVSQAAVLGTLSGSVMGAGANLLPGSPDVQPPKPPPAPPKEEKPAAPLLLGNTPDPIVVFPDGTAGRRADLEAYVNGLPEDQQVAARAKLMGMGARDAKPEDILAAPDADSAIATFTASLTGADMGALMGQDNPLVTASREMQAQTAADEAELAGLAQTEARDLNTMRALAVEDARKQAELDGALTVPQREDPPAKQSGYPVEVGKPIEVQGRREKFTVTYSIRPDGRLTRTIQYGDGTVDVSSLATDKKGDETWVSNTQYERGEYYPVQLSDVDGQAKARDDVNDLGTPVQKVPDQRLVPLSKRALVQPAADGVPAAVDPSQPINQPLTTENTSAQTPEAQQSPPPGQTPAASAAPVPASIPDPVQPAEGGAVSTKAQTDQRLIPVSRRGGTPLTPEENRQNSIAADAGELAMQLQNESAEPDFDPKEATQAIKNWAEGRNYTEDELRAAVIADLNRRPQFRRKAGLMSVLSKAPDPRLVPVSQRPASDHVGRNNVPLADGGKPFKTNKAAKDAKKNQPLLRVVRVEGGFALAPKTEAQITAEAKNAKRLAAPRFGNPGVPLAAHEFIAGRGGLRGSERSDMGMEGNTRVGNRFLFASAGGMDMDEATEALKEAGYLKDDASHDDARNLISRSLKTPQYTAEGTEQMAEREQEERRKAFEAEQEAIALAQEAEDNELEIAAAAFEEAMLDMPQGLAQSDMSMEDALLVAGYTQQELENERNQAERAEVDQGPAETPPGNGPQGDRGREGAQGEDQAAGSQSQGLTAPTRADVLRQQAEAEAEAQRKEQGGDKPVERKVTGDTPDMFNTQGSVFDAPDREMLPPSTDAQAAESAKRKRPHGTIEFSRPIVGDNGNRLLSYSWQWKPFEYVDNRGEERVARVSDWENSETSAETGREVVHQFTVDVDGKLQTVSAEGALRLLGFLSSDRTAGFKSIASAAKTLARLKMQQAELQSAREAFDKDMAAVNALPLPPMPTKKSVVGKTEGWWVLGDAQARQIEPGPMTEERKRFLTNDWRSNRLAERGWKRGGLQLDQFNEQARDLSQRIAKAEKKVDELAKAQATAGPTAPADPAAQATTILDAANITGKDRLDILKDVKSGALTPGEVQAAFPGVSPPVANESPAEYDVSEPGAPYETDLFGQPVPAPAGRTGSARPASAGVRGNVQPSIGVQDTPAPAGEYFASTLVGSEVSRELGASRITKPEHAAQATTYLYKSAVERLDGIVTDAAGKPLAIVGGFKGALAQASVYPATIMAEAVRIPGAARIWFSHNHPSGNPELSNADRRLGEVLSDVFYGSGIEPMGMLAIGSGRFSHIMGGNEIVSRDIPTSSASVSVPVIERTLAPNGVTGVTVSSPSAAKQYARDFYDRSKKPGLILLNTQNSIIGWVPITDQMTGELRGTGGLNAIYRAISESNAGGAIIVHGGELGFQSLPRQFQRVTPSENIAAALAKIDVRPLDSIEITPMGAKSTAESGLNVASGPVYARSTQGRGVNIDDAKAVVASVREALPTAPTIYIMESVAQAPADLRKFIKAAGAENDVDAAYHNGEIYVFPANIPSIERMQFVLAHHEIRHHGLASMLGPRKNAVMLKIHESNPKIRALAAEQVRKGYAKSRILATEEALADMPVADLVKLNGFDRIVAAVREWLRGAAARLRRAGLGNIADAIDAKTWTDKDVVALIARAEGVSRGGSAKYASEGTVFGQDGDMPAFYSALTREINANTARAQPAMGWASTIQGLVKAGKIKQDEVDWSGVLDWLRLQGGKVTREQLVAFLDANGVRVEETVLGGGNKPPGYDADIELLSDNGLTLERNPEDPSMVAFMDENGELLSADELAEEPGLAKELVLAAYRVQEAADADKVPTRYANYQLPGGSNYREVLLTLPAKSTADPARAEYEVWASRNGLQPNATFTEERYKRETGNDAPAPRTMTAMNADAAQNFKSTHWDQPNVLAHIRVNDRVDVDGKRVLFVEEIQSDWGQEGKKKGFVSGVAATAKNLSAVPDGDTGAWYVYPKSRTEDAAPYIGIRTFANSGAAAIAETSAHPWNRIISGDKGDVLTGSEAGKTPSAPFVTNTDKWLTLALKRIVKMAVDEGYDRVAFVNGDQSAARYDLSKQIGAINYEPIPDTDLFEIEATDLNGKTVLAEDEVTLARIEELVGKEIAKKIEAREGKVKGEGGYRNWHRLSGLDLKVGGEGMKKFYDAIVPNTLKDVLRKVGGGAVEKVSFGSAAKQAGWRYEKNEDGLYDIYGPDGFVDTVLNEQAAGVAIYDYSTGSNISISDQRGNNKAPAAQPGFTITPAMREKAAGGLPMFDRNADLAQLEALLRAVAPGRSETAASVRDMVSPLSDKWSIPITVVQRPDQLPVPAPSDARGLYHNGAIYLVASNLNSRAAVMRTLGHEAIAHHGLREMLGDDGFSTMMRQINMAVKAGNPAMRKISEYVRRTYVDEDGKFELTPEQEADEIAARAVEDGIDPASGEFRPGFGWLKGVFAKVAQFLRDLGITVPMSNTELQGVLVNSMRGLEAGAKLQGQGQGKMAAAARSSQQARAGTPQNEVKDAIQRWTGADVSKAAPELVKARALKELRAALADDKMSADDMHNLAYNWLAKSYEYAPASGKFGDGEAPSAVVSAMRAGVAKRAAAGKRHDAVVLPFRGQFAVVIDGRVLQTEPTQAAAEEAMQDMDSEFWRGAFYDIDGNDQGYERWSEDAAGGALFARSVVTGATIPQAWQAPDPTKMDDFLYTMQDRHIDTKRVVTAVRDAIGGIADNLDPYLQEELYHGRAAKATKDFLEQAIRPLMVDMQARGVEMSDFEEYLHNRHAERRNEQVAKVNPNMPDGGSGIKTADARAYLAGLPAAKRTAYQALARRVDQMNRDTRALLVSSGLEKQATIDAWQAAYGDEYVPLMREEMDNGAMGIGQGFSVRGSSSKRAMGSDKPVANILANIALQREKAITRAEKRRIGEALYGMVLSAPNPDFWIAVDPALQQSPAQITATSMQLISMGMNPVDAQAIAAEPTQRYIDPRTGQVASRVNPALRSADNVLAVRIDGEDKYVFFNAQDPRAMRMAKALKNLDADQLGTVMGNVAKMTRYFAAVNTQFNPVFGVVNLTRDIQTALLNLQSTGLAGKQAEVMKHVGSALRGIYIDLRDHRAGKTPTSTWAGLFEEFQREGGATGYRDMYANAQERAGAIADELKKVKQGKAMEFGRGVFGWLSDYNESMENAVRLATYKVAKEQGMSSQQAASIAKNLTVNFNRKGQVALQAGALYAFFNAAVQGTARLAETMFSGGKLSATGKKIMAGGLLLGSMQALLLAAAGYDDEEPPDFVRERSLVIPIGGDKYVSIPMPLGFHVIPNLARIPTEWALGGFRDTPKRIGQLVGLFADAFNPIGSAGLSLQTLAPTIIDPLAALAENRDWTGKPIAKKDFNSMQPTAGHTRAKDTATPWGRAIAYGVNWVTGGTDYKPGMASPTPDQIDYLIGQATGGVGREVSKLSQVAGSTVSGEELPLYKIPLLGRFVGTTAGQAAESGRFYENLKQIGEHDAELSGLKKDRRMAEYQEYMRDNPEARLVPIADRTYREVSKLIRMKRDALKAGASTERIKMLDQQITARMAAFNQRVRATETRETATQE